MGPVQRLYERTSSAPGNSSVPTRRIHQTYPRQRSPPSSLLWTATMYLVLLDHYFQYACQHHAVVSCCLAKASCFSRLMNAREQLTRPPWGNMESRGPSRKECQTCSTIRSLGIDGHTCLSGCNPVHISAETDVVVGFVTTCR